MILEMSVRRALRGARAFRPLVLAYRKNELFATWNDEGRDYFKRRVRKVRGGGTPPPTRRMRALPGVRSRTFPA